MALNLDDFKRDLTEIVTDLPVTFIFGGTSYTGFAGQNTTRETLEPGGYLEDLDRNLHVPVFTANASGSYVNTFPGATPVLGDILVIINDGTYKAVEVRRAQDGLLLSYGLETVNR